jgi:hypothetical protein
MLAPLRWRVTIDSIPRTITMKSTDVYREIRKVIGPWCKENQFQKGPGGMLCYVKPQAARFVVFWFQCAQGVECVCGLAVRRRVSVFQIKSDRFLRGRQRA